MGIYLEYSPKGGPQLFPLNGWLNFQFSMVKCIDSYGALGPVGYVEKNPG